MEYILIYLPHRATDIDATLHCGRRKRFKLRNSHAVYFDQRMGGAMGRIATICLAAAEARFCARRDVLLTLDYSGGLAPTT